jgi:hypothetical protein
LARPPSKIGRGGVEGWKHEFMRKLKGTAMLWQADGHGQPALKLTVVARASISDLKFRSQEVE